VESGRKVIDNDDFFALFEEREHHMTADIAGPSGNKNRHSNVLRENRRSGSRLPISETAANDHSTETAASSHRITPRSRPGLQGR
jgi:ribosomal protein L32